MQNFQFSPSLRAIFAILTLVFLTAALAANAQETVLLSFNGTSDAGRPHVPVVMDAAGNLYGTAPERGAQGAGAVFKLSPDGHGGWTETVLYSFTNDGQDGLNPLGNLTQDTAGNLYGVTISGGANGSLFGTVYELKRQSTGWQERV